MDSIEQRLKQLEDKVNSLLPRPVGDPLKHNKFENAKFLFSAKDTTNMLSVYEREVSGIKRYVVVDPHDENALTALDSELNDIWLTKDQLELVQKFNFLANTGSCLKLRNGKYGICEVSMQEKALCIGGYTQDREYLSIIYKNRGLFDAACRQLLEII